SRYFDWMARAIRSLYIRRNTRFMCRKSSLKAASLPARAAASSSGKSGRDSTCEGGMGLSPIRQGAAGPGFSMMLARHGAVKQFPAQNRGESCRSERSAKKTDFARRMRTVFVSMYVGDFRL